MIGWPAIPQTVCGRWTCQACGKSVTGRCWSIGPVRFVCWPCGLKAGADPAQPERGYGAPASAVEVPDVPYRNSAGWR